MSFLKFLGKASKDNSELELPPIDVGPAPDSRHDISGSRLDSDILGSQRPMPAVSQPMPESPQKIQPPPMIEKPVLMRPPTTSPTDRPQMATPPKPPESHLFSGKQQNIISHDTPEWTSPKSQPPKRHADLPAIERPRRKIFDDGFLAEPILRPNTKDASPRSHRHDVEGPLYVKVDEFRSVMADLDLILNNLKESNNIMIRLNSIKNGVDSHFDKWHSEMEDIQRKLVFIDKTLFEELI